MQSAASIAANIVLLTEFAMGAALLAGAVLARRRQYRAHAWCQSTVVVLNLVVIGFAMVPSFYVQGVAKLPRAIRRPYYAVAAGHAALGAFAELLSLYVILAAGTNLLPARFRFRNYRAWMRATLIMWWLAVLLGIATYLRWYMHAYPVRRELRPSLTYLFADVSVKLVRHG